jgi:hypothetical protein
LFYESQLNGTIRKTPQTFAKKFIGFLRSIADDDHCGVAGATTARPLGL